jgi:hypothetical protein
VTIELFSRKDKHSRYKGDVSRTSFPLFLFFLMKDASKGNKNDSLRGESAREDFLYGEMDHDLLAVSDYVKVDPRTLQEYIRKRHEKYRVI